jgi:hypothetical protein
VFPDRFCERFVGFNVVRREIGFSPVGPVGLDGVPVRSNSLDDVVVIKTLEFTHHFNASSAAVYAQTPRRNDNIRAGFSETAFAVDDIVQEV